MGGAEGKRRGAGADHLARARLEIRAFQLPGHAASSGRDRMRTGHSRPPRAAESSRGRTRTRRALTLASAAGSGCIDVDCWAFDRPVEKRSSLLPRAIDQEVRMAEIHRVNGKRAGHRQNDELGGAREALDVGCQAALDKEVEPVYDHPERP